MPFAHYLLCWVVFWLINCDKCLHFILPAVYLPIVLHCSYIFRLTSSSVMSPCLSLILLAMDLESSTISFAWGRKGQRQVTMMSHWAYRNGRYGMRADCLTFSISLLRSSKAWWRQRGEERRIRTANSSPHWYQIWPWKLTETGLNNTFTTGNNTAVVYLIMTGLHYGYITWH